MNCWHCNSQLIWGGDEDMEDMNLRGEDGIVTNLSCPGCPAYVMVFLPIPETDDSEVKNPVSKKEADGEGETN